MSEASRTIEEMAHEIERLEEELKRAGDLVEETRTAEQERGRD